MAQIVENTIILVRWSNALDELLNAKLSTLLIADLETLLYVRVETHPLFLSTFLTVVEVIEGDSGSSNSNPDDRSGGNPTDSISRHHHAETGALKAKVAPISTDSCQLWSHLTKEIQISVIAYTLVALLVTAILLFSYAVCRIKNG